MTKVRFRLTGFHYFWALSVGVSFFFGYLDKQCYITFSKFTDQKETPKTYQLRINTPLTLFAPLQGSQMEQIHRILGQSDQVAVGSSGFLATSHYMFRKTAAWFASEKESARLAEAGCPKVNFSIVKRI